MQCKFADQQSGIKIKFPYTHINTGTLMKTTIEISDALFSEARLLAATEGTTLRQLVEVGLRYVLGQHKRQAEPFKLRDATFGSDTSARGLAEELAGASWDQLRDLAFEGRGGEYRSSP